jgi:hypothetical protein
MWKWFLGENGDFELLFLTAKNAKEVAKGTKTLRFFSRQDAESQSFWDASHYWNKYRSGFG